jgi:prepilin-type N-terminal cleavage/methylation domain-containing protein
MPGHSILVVARAPRPAGRTRALRDDRGFTLVEMLLATTLTLVVLGLTMTTLMTAKNANDLGGMIMDANQNLRSGMTFMVRDIIQTANGVPIGGIPIPSGRGSTRVNRPGPVAGTQFPDTGVLQAVTPGPGLGPRIEGQETDLITVLYADRSLPLDEFPLARVQNNGARVTVDNRTDISDASNRIRVGDLVLFSNALGNAIQTVTRVNGNVIRFEPGDPFNLNQPNAEAGTIRQLQANRTFPPTTATRIVMSTYFIDATTNPRQPRLVRRTNFDAARPVALVVENLQVTYDLVDGSNTINTALINVAEPVAPQTAAQIRGVNLFLAARSERTDGRNRRPFRTNLSTRVSIRSLAYVDRYR